MDTTNKTTKGLWYNHADSVRLVRKENKHMKLIALSLNLVALSFRTINNLYVRKNNFYSAREKIYDLCFFIVSGGPVLSEYLPLLPSQTQHAIASDVIVELKIVSASILSGIHSRKCLFDRQSYQCTVLLKVKLN